MQCFQVVLSMVVVHLHESDYVAADNCYKESFEYVLEGCCCCYYYYYHYLF